MREVQGLFCESEINKLDEGKSYRFEKVTVREYGGNKYLSMSEAAEVKEIGDIGDVVSDEEEGIGDAQNVVEGEIIAILVIDEYISCVNYRGKVKGRDEVIGECIKCKAKVKMSRCSKSASAKFVVEGSSGRMWYLTAFDEQVTAIIANECGSSIEERMLSASSMKFVTSSKIVREIKK